MESEKYPSDAAAKFMVRLPGDMRDRIAEEAKTNNRSMNAEIVQRLQSSFEFSLKLAEARSEASVLREQLAEEFGKARAEREKLSSDYIVDIDARSRILEQLRYTQLQYREISYLFDLLVPVLLEIQEKAPEMDLPRSQRSALQVAAAIQATGESRLSELVRAFLSGELEPTAAAKVKTAFDHFDWAIQLLDAREQGDAAPRTARGQPKPHAKAMREKAAAAKDAKAARKKKMTEIRDEMSKAMLEALSRGDPKR